MQIGARREYTGINTNRSVQALGLFSFFWVMKWYGKLSQPPARNRYLGVDIRNPVFYAVSRGMLESYGYLIRHTPGNGIKYGIFDVYTHISVTSGGCESLPYHYITLVRKMNSNQRCTHNALICIYSYHARSCRLYLQMSICLIIPF